MIPRPALCPKRSNVPMKCDIPAPLDRLVWFQEKLSLKTEEEEKINQYRAIFAEKKTVFWSLRL